MMKMRLRAIQTMTNDSKRPRRLQWLNINGTARETSDVLMLVILGLTVNLIALVDFENTPSNGSKTKIFVPYYNAPSFNPARQWCFACGNYGHWRAQCKSIQMLRQQNRSYINLSFFPNVQQQTQTPKLVVNKISLKDMKDEYSCNFYKNIDVDEQFLIENEQHVVDGVD